LVAAAGRRRRRSREQEWQPKTLSLFTQRTGTKYKRNQDFRI
jgi:hypothetical protein